MLRSKTRPLPGHLWSLMGNSFGLFISTHDYIIRLFVYVCMCVCCSRIFEILYLLLKGHDLFSCGIFLHDVSWSIGRWGLYALSKYAAHALDSDTDLIKYRLNMLESPYLHTRCYLSPW